MTFSTETYTHRRHVLMSAVGNGLILLMGNGEAPMNYGANTYRFRQDSTFLYYLGIDRAGLAALLDCETGAVTIFGDELEMDDIVWTGPQPTIAAQAAKAGVGNTAPFASLSDRLAEARNAGKPVHFLPPYRGENSILLQKWLYVKPSEAREKASEALIRAVVAQRSIKSEEEIAEIHKACTTTSRMHRRAMEFARPGMIEAEVAAQARAIALAADGDLSFPIICSVNGQTLHNHHHHNKIEEGRLLLVDTGAEAPSCYAGDMTRTFPTGSTFTQKQREIYQIVLDSQLSAIDMLAPGVAYKDVHLKAASVIANGLTDLGLMQGDPEQAVASGAHALFFPHGLGHMMGLDVHDMEDLGENYVGYDAQVQRSDQFGTAYLRLGRALQPGFVLTVEPGIYFIPELIDMWRSEGKFAQFLNFDIINEYRDFGGIRIEDDYVITSSGARLLGEPAPKTVEDVETVRTAALGR
ncbi:MAG: aminopeptidase P family protein [Bacteroidia bacterium]